MKNPERAVEVTGILSEVRMSLIAIFSRQGCSKVSKGECTVNTFQKHLNPQCYTPQLAVRASSSQASTVTSRTCTDVRQNGHGRACEGCLTAGMSSLKMDLLTSNCFSLSKKVAFRKERCPKGNLAGMVFE